MDDLYILRSKLTFFGHLGKTKSMNIQNLYICHAIVPAEISSVDFKNLY